MSTPMYDEPVHFKISVDINGDGPAEPEDTDREVCWCGEEGCEKYQTR